MKMAQLMLSEASAKKLHEVPLSGNTVKWRIARMSSNIKEQVVKEIKVSTTFSFQLDESVDVASCSQLLVFVRCVLEKDVKEEFLFCTRLDTTTTADDVMDKVS